MLDIENPIITVIVPNFNKQEYIRECLDSILNLTFSRFECIIIDDGSTDDSRTIINEFCNLDKRFKVFYNSNHGLSYSRNFGILHALGTYILPVDSDDYIDSTYIERAILTFEKYPNLTLFYGKWYFFGYNADYMNSNLGNLHYSNYQTLLKGNSIHCSCIYRKEDAINCGLYDVTMKAYEDWDFLIRLLYKDKYVAYDNRISLYYRQFELSKSSYGHKYYNEIYKYIVNKNSTIFKEYKMCF